MACSCLLPHIEVGKWPLVQWVDYKHNEKIMYQKNKNLQPYFEEKMQNNNGRQIKKRR
jgi:hypothetical protein